MRHLALSVCLCCAGAWALVYAPCASADIFGPIALLSERPVQLASGTVDEQAEYAEESVISGNGRFIAFVGSFGGVAGIWRRDLETGAVEQVAPSTSRIPPKLPSISADGRYVSFTTTTALAPEDDHNHAPDVYVRDMDKPCSMVGGACLPCAEDQDAAEREGCPFVLVSAVNGSEEGATYHYAYASEEEGLGSLAGGRTAMSADGRYVVFETAAESDLLGAATPPREILVRDLETDETSLVSSEYDPQTEADTGVPVPMVEGVGAAYPVEVFNNAKFGGASISADGSTVAWLGQDIGRQAKLLPAEQAAYPVVSNEPVWRRIHEGPSAPTRRVTGGSEPENPLCIASGETELPGSPSPLDPCHGPFARFDRLQPNYVLETSHVNFVPQLDEHGDEVAFLASAPVVGSGTQLFENETSSDVYVSEIGGSSTRVQALRRLTEAGTNGADTELAAKIVDLGISPDGSQVAFTTRRTQFPLGSPSYVSPTAPQPGFEELYDADLADETITRVTHGYAGTAVPSEQAGSDEEAEGASSPSFTESGNTLSFSSSADNLVYGDGNGASDAFVDNRVVLSGTTPVQFVSSAPVAPALAPSWQLYAVVEPQADGAVVLEVTVPGEGELSAGASAAVPVTVSAARATRARARAHRARRTRTELMTRGVASARAAVLQTTDGLQELTLTLAPAYRALAQRADGLYSTITLRFTAPGHPDLSASLNVSFRRSVRAARSTRAARSSRKRKQRRR